MVYKDEMEASILSEFEAHPDADIIVFHFASNSDRTVKKCRKTRKCSRFSRMPWGTFRVAFRLKELKKANIWFTTLFGGGCLFPSGEDSMWLTEARRNGLTMYVSDKTIGTVTHKTSTWFTGYDEKFYFGKGAFYQAARPKLIFLWMCYFALRTRGWGNLSYSEKMKWMRLGAKGYRRGQGFEFFRELQTK